VTTLLDLKAPRPRFARSINIERDAGSDAIDGYLPVSRAIDTIARLARALDSDDAEVALSITGPYGSGKSSLALVIDALLGPHRDPARQSAEELLSVTAPEALACLDSARRRLGAHRYGFIRAVVTAQREPIGATVLRALLHGAKRYPVQAKQKPLLTRSLKALQKMRVDLLGDATTRPTARDICSAVSQLAEVAPVLLLIDEFGKNLEAFADSRSDGDLHLLQELAEGTRNGARLALVTLQHMAFDEYADTATAAQRREWVKIQGRFEDIPFVDSPLQTRTLIAAAFAEPDGRLHRSLGHWASQQADELSKIGLRDLAADRELLAQCWPIHPVALAALPELCARYGQNERTLFSFLAGHEPRSVASFLGSTTWCRTKALPVVRLDLVYDYFIDAAATKAGVSAAASRWLEIDTRLRDAHGLDAAARRVLKSVGLLNLVSAGGTLRASRAVVTYACSDGQDGTDGPKQVTAKLAELEHAGLVTFRDFADEYRVWQGSDYDLRAALELARRRIRDEPAAEVVDRVLPLGPVVAGRHSHESGTLRAFARAWVGLGADRIEPLGAQDREDGIVFYLIGDHGHAALPKHQVGSKPVAFVTAVDTAALVEAAREVAAIDEVLQSAEDLQDDWVARRELIERRVETQVLLDEAFHEAFGASSTASVKWSYDPPPGAQRSRRHPFSAVSASQALSKIADAWYSDAPHIRNDLVNRHNLSSQAAKARRVVLTAMLDAADQEALGIQGHGPDNTLYRSVLQDLGIHSRSDDAWGFTEPRQGSLVPTWKKLVGSLTQATSDRVRVDALYSELSAAPFGVRAGVAPVIFLAALIVHREDVALYEHGTFRPGLTADLIERLLRNPDNFEVKHFSSRSGKRAAFLARLADRLGMTTDREMSDGRTASLVAVVSKLVGFASAVPEHIRKTRQLSADALAVRKVLFAATEPDELIFSAIPIALGKPRILASRPYDDADLDEIAHRLAVVVDELRAAYPALLLGIRSAIREELRAPDEGLRERLAARAREIERQVIDQRVARLIVALVADVSGDDEWVEYVAMSVTGRPPAAWTDEERTRFFRLLHDIGGTFRRVEALNATVRSRDDGYDAVRVTLTRPDGVEAAKLVWIDESRRAALGNILADALADAGAQLGSDAEARDALLALLAELDLESENLVGIERGARPDAYPVSGIATTKAAENR
jgi:hypothetical protein